MRITALKSKTILTACCLLLSLAFAARASADDGASHSPYEEYNLTLKAHISMPLSTAIFRDTEGRSLDIEYSALHPLYLSRWGGELIFHGFSALYEKNMYDFFQQVDYNFQVAYTGQYFCVEFFYTVREKYYLYDPTLQDNSEEQQKYDFYPEPDVASRHYGANFYGILSSDFSFNAGFRQGERQSRSAGAIMVKLTPSRCILETDTGFIPYNQRAFFGDEGVLNTMTVDAVAVSAGYAYNLTSGGWFVMPYGFIGYEFREIDYNSQSGNRGISDRALRYDYGIYLGYNESDSILVVRYALDHRDFELEKTSIKFDDKVFQVIIGFRM